MGTPARALGAEDLEKLMAYSWPGNVRELQNVIERAVILSSRGHIAIGDPLAPAPAADGPSGQTLRLEEVERQHILAVLERTGWRVSGERGAAKILGLKRTTLESRMKKLGIERR